VTSSYRCTLRFRTPYALTQDTAQEFWLHGYRFHRKGGGRTYEWVTDVSSPDGMAAEQHASGMLGEILRRAGIASVDHLASSVVRISGASDGESSPPLHEEWAIEWDGDPDMSGKSRVERQIMLTGRDAAEYALTWDMPRWRGRSPRLARRMVTDWEVVADDGDEVG
jgi:hypothetical protein